MPALARRRESRSRWHCNLSIGARAYAEQRSRCVSVYGSNPSASGCGRAGSRSIKWQRPETSSEDSMPITSHLFEAYLKCSTKCFLRSRGETATENSYANWVRTQQLSYTFEGINQLVKGFTKDEVITNTIDSKETQSPKWRLAIQTIAHTRNLESIIHAVEHRTPEGERNRHPLSRLNSSTRIQYTSTTNSH